MIQENFDRRLAAVVAADIAGYSRMMSIDEDATMAAWWSHRREIIDPKMSEHRGRIVKHTGDGFLAEFPSCLDAMRFALSMQTEIGQRNSPLPPDRRMDFRVGINLGDIMADDEDIYGDGVNIAARLEALAQPGGICVSGTVFDQIRNRLPVGYEDLGEQTVKNIDTPIRVYRVRLNGEEDDTSSDRARVTRPAETPPVDLDALPDRPSIAVLPFDNMGGDPEQEYFADGMTEDIITELSRFQDLLVIARNSVFTYKGKAVNIPQLSRELKVRYVLEGSVRKSGNRVRIAAQLIDAVTGHHLWAERFDRDLEDVFAVQDEVTRRIVATLAGKVAATEQQRARANDRTENLRAYELVLRGRELWFRFTPEDNLEARRHYERAIELDPDYARAYGSLAWTYMIEYDRHWTDTPEDTLDKALKFARKGVDVNPMSHSNFLTLGQVLMSQGRLDKAVNAFNRGIELNPNDADGYAFLAFVNCYLGEPEKAIELIEHSLQLNASSATWRRTFFVIAYFVARRYEEAVDAMYRLESPPYFIYRWFAAALAHLGRTEEAWTAFEEYLQHNPGFSLAKHLKTLRFRKPEDAEHYAEGLRRAGAPE